MAKISFKNKNNNRQQSPPRRNQEEGKKQPIRGLSASSRLRFQRELASINFIEFGGRILWITLTYPAGKWPKDPEGWKKHLDNLRKRFERKYGDTPGFWRLELQNKTGEFDPHFHLILFMDESRLTLNRLKGVRDFVAEAWYEVCGKISKEHLSAGTQVKEVKTREYWERLTKYVTKKEKSNDKLPKTGKVWGVWRKEGLPVNQETVQILFYDAIKIRRWF